MKLSCTFCGKELSTTSKTAAQRVTGWVSPRRGGGANHIRFAKPSESGEWAHVRCLEEAYHPAQANQGELFGNTHHP